MHFAPFCGRIRFWLLNKNGFTTGYIPGRRDKNVPVYSAGSGVYHLLFHLDGRNLWGIPIAALSDECSGVYYHIGNFHQFSVQYG